MAHSASSSHGVGSGASARSVSSRPGGGLYDGQGSPVPYRVGPLAYSPDVRCKCGDKACRWISWSDDHPGHRYYRCQNDRMKLELQTIEDCGFFKWLDLDCSEWFKQMLRDLRDAVWDLKKVVRQQDQQLVAKDKLLVEKNEEIKELMKELEEKHLELSGKQQQLSGKQQELFAKHQEVSFKQQQLVAKHQEVQAKEDEVKALQQKLKNKNQSFDILVLFCFVLVVFLVLTMLNAKA